MQGHRSIGGFGMACAAAGIIVAAGVMAWIKGPRASGVGLVVISGSAAGSVGYAIAYGRQALLSRVGSRSLEGATILAQSLACAALTVWMGAPFARDYFGDHAAMILLALSLLALGGILVIHEPGKSARVRRVRVCVVFAPIAAMIILFLLAPGWWTSS